MYIFAIINPSAIAEKSSNLSFNNNVITVPKIQPMKSFLQVQRLFILAAGLLVVLTGHAQTPTFSCYITNEVRVSSQVYQFDIYLLRTGTTAFEYAGGQW